VNAVAGTANWRTGPGMDSQSLHLQGRIKTAKPFSCRQKLFDWLEFNLVPVKSYANCSSWIVLTGAISRGIALLKALPALASVIVRCDESPRDFSNHYDAVLGLHEARPDALCCSRVGLCVSAVRIRTPTVMLRDLPSNDRATWAHCCRYAH
jgi:hypothetical protein